MKIIIYIVSALLLLGCKQTQYSVAEYQQAVDYFNAMTVPMSEFEQEYSCATNALEAADAIDRFTTYLTQAERMHTRPDLEIIYGTLDGLPQRVQEASANYRNEALATTQIIEQLLSSKNEWGSDLTVKEALKRFMERP